MKQAAALLLALTFIIPQMGCSSNGQNQNYTGISKTGFYLDTICAITVYGVDRSSVLGHELAAAADEAEQTRLVHQLITDAFLECDRYEKLLSKTIESSEISQINDASGQTVEVSTETAEVIEKGIWYGKVSDGLFDITIGKASALWDFHEAEDVAGDEAAAESLLPDEAELAEAVKHVDYRQVAVNGLSVKLDDPDMEIDLGGIAKGYIADRVTEFLEENGVVSAVVDLGGNIVAIGGKTSGLLVEEAAESESVFNIGIKDPQSEGGELLAVFPVHDKTVVTSGTYERFLIQDGVKYHHILDPATGWPINNDVLSVTIVADKGCAVDADGLSTTCLALGVEKGMELIESLNYMGVEAVFVDADGEIHKTEGAPELTTS
ncbi:MAG: FAD:protein FMN transferase [Firmicutes bacterium]|nr:FAD:protein FMN transferase [Bacillota bacterium]